MKFYQLTSTDLITCRSKRHYNPSTGTNIFSCFFPSRWLEHANMPEKSGSYPGTCFWLLINIQKRPIEFFVPYSSQSDFFVQDKKFQIFPPWIIWNHLIFLSFFSLRWSNLSPILKWFRYPTYLTVWFDAKKCHVNPSLFLIRNRKLENERALETLTLSLIIMAWELQWMSHHW